MEPVSVVVPCHNQAHFVAEAIASIRAQDWPIREVVVVDDGSTDESAAIASGAGARVVSQDRRGAAAARNTGIRHTAGRLIAFLDADDLWPPGSLAARAIALRDAGADMVFGRIEQRSHGASFDDRAPFALGRLAGALLLPRSSFELVGPFDESLMDAETIDWVARADEAKLRSVTVEDVVLIRRIHGANMMIQTTDGAKRRLAVLRAAIQRRRRLVDHA